MRYYGPNIRCQFIFLRIFLPIHGICLWCSALVFNGYPQPVLTHFVSVVLYLYWPDNIDLLHFCSKNTCNFVSTHMFRTERSCAALSLEAYIQCRYIDLTSIFSYIRSISWGFRLRISHVLYWSRSDFSLSNFLIFWSNCTLIINF